MADIHVKKITTPKPSIGRSAQPIKSACPKCYKLVTLKWSGVSCSCGYWECF